MKIERKGKNSINSLSIRIQLQRYKLMLNTYGQQLRVVIILSIAFMLIFTSYTSVEGIITKFYEDKEHQYFGPISLIILYSFFALSTIYSSTLINALGYRKIFMLAAFFYTLFESSALIIYFSDNQFVLILVIVTTSTLCGCAAGNIWVALNSYIGLIASKQHVNGFYGLSEGIRSLSTVLGYILSVYIFKNYSGLEYFVVVAPLSMLSIVLFSIIPQPESKRQQINQQIVNQSGFSKIEKYFKLLFIKKNEEIYTYETLSSIIAMLMAFFIYKINSSIIKPEQSQSQQQFENRSTSLLALVLLWYGTGRCISGFLLKYLLKQLKTFFFCQLSAWMCLVSMLFSLFSFLTSSYLLLCICSFIFGISYAFTKTSCNILIKQVFDNDLDMIGINYLVSSFAFVFSIFLLFLLNKISIYLCFVVFLLFFAFAIRSTNRIGVKFRQATVQSIELITIESKR